LLNNYDIIDTVDSYKLKSDYEASYKGLLIIENKFEANKDSLTSSSNHLSKGSKAIRLYNINNKSSILKNIFITRFRIIVSSGGYTNIVLSDLIVEVFSTMYKSSKFIPRKEPLLSTYICRFSSADLLLNIMYLKLLIVPTLKKLIRLRRRLSKAISYFLNRYTRTMYKNLLSL
jgi:hypothetical protein